MYVCTMSAKKPEPRLLKGYKIKDTVYQKAKKRATKEKTPLATLIEQWVEGYSSGKVVDIN